MQAVTEGVLDDMARMLAETVEPEEDPVRRIAGAFAAYCTVIRDSRQAVMLTYRESNTLDETGRSVVKDLEDPHRRAAAQRRGRRCRAGSGCARSIRRAASPTTC